MNDRDGGLRKIISFEVKYISFFKFSIEYLHSTYLSYILKYFPYILDEFIEFKALYSSVIQLFWDLSQ